MPSARSRRAPLSRGPCRAAIPSIHLGIGAPPRVRYPRVALPMGVAHSHSVFHAFIHEPPEAAPSTYSADRLTPHTGGIRDGVHPRVAPPPPCPGSAPALSAARARPWLALSVSGSRCSSRRSSTESPADASHRLPRYGPDIRVESSQSRARHRRFATAILAL